MTIFNAFKILLFLIMIFYYMFNKLPIDIVNRVLEYDGSIKYRFGVYMDQINVHDEKYDNLKEITNNKYNIANTIKMYYGLKNPYYMEIYIHNKDNMKFGVIYDYYYKSNEFMISVYKDISKTDEYLKEYAFNKMRGIYTRYYFVEYFIYN